MAVKVYLGSYSAAHSEMTYEEADAFSVSTPGDRRISRSSRRTRGCTPKSCGSRDHLRGDLSGRGTCGELPEGTSGPAAFAVNSAAGMLHHPDDDPLEGFDLPKPQNVRPAIRCSASPGPAVRIQALVGSRRSRINHA